MYFSDYMNLWLYGKEGYYKTFKAIGKSGDFYTSVSASSFFGASIANYFYELLKEGRADKNGWLIEIGAHQGYLICDMIQWLYTCDPSLVQTLKFGIVERQPEVQKEQLAYIKERFGDDVQITHFNDLAEVEAVYAFIVANEIFVESPFAHPSVMFRGSVISAAGGYRHGDFPEDYELWLRLHAQGSRMEKLPEVLLHWRDTPQRLSRQDSRYRREAFDNVRAEYLSQDPRLRKHAGSFAIWGAGRRTRQRCAWLLRRGLNPCAWIDIDPRKIGNRLNGVPVVAPDWLIANRVFVLGYVSNHGARDDIAHWLSEHGYERGENFLMIG